MLQPTTITINIQGAGMAINKTFRRLADHSQSYEVTVPAAKASTGFTRSGDDTGIVSLAAGHGFSGGDKVDVYWDGGLLHAVSVDDADATSITLDGGAGDVLPASDTPLVIGKRVEITTPINGDVLVFAVVCLGSQVAVPEQTFRGFVDFRSALAAQIFARELVANEPVVLDIDGGGDNPLEGAVVANTYVSSANVANATTLQFFVLADSTP